MELPNPGSRCVADSCETKIRRGNMFNLVMSRLGSDLEPIRSEFAFDPTWQPQNGPKTEPKCIQNRPKSHTNQHDQKRNLLSDPTCQSPAFYKTIKICWENECFLKADLCIHAVNPQWLQSDAKLNQHHLHKQKVTSKSLQNDSKVTPKWPQSGAKVTSKWVMTYQNPLAKCV